MAKINDLPLLSNPTEDMYCLVGKKDLHKVPWSAIMGQIGSPYVATAVSQMTDKTRVYVYQGSESGYTSGNWYYWNGSAWTSGGTYNSAVVDTDKTLTQSDKPADSAVVGQEIGQLKESLGNKITKFYASNQGETHITDSDNGKIMDMKVFGKSQQDGTPSPENPVEIKSVVNPTVKVTNEDGLKVQSVTFNDITLYSVPVKDGGNITINGQKYIADYIDIENRKIVKFVKKIFIKQTRWSKAVNNGVFRFYSGVTDAFGIGGNKVIKNSFAISSHFVFSNRTPNRVGYFTINADGTYANAGFAFSTDPTTTSDDFNNWILSNKPFVLLATLKEELPLTTEQILALKALATYYPVTNISINSEQLDGYTVFNYPINMKNGWNYVKQQIGDTREYIYDMDARTQDTDLQAAEAYVNSEYAVALTELEV